MYTDKDSNLLIEEVSGLIPTDGTILFSHKTWEMFKTVNVNIFSVTSSFISISDFMICITLDMLKIMGNGGSHSV